MTESQAVEYVDLPGIEKPMPMASVVPETGTVDDSRHITLSLGFGEPFEHSLIVAQALANQTGHPVTTYERQVATQSDRPSAISFHSRDALLIADEYGEARFKNATAKVVAGHSLAGLGIAHLASEEPDRFGVVQLTKAVGTTTILDADLNYLEQLAILDEKSSVRAGIAMLLRLAPPSHAATLVPQMVGPSREMRDVFFHGLHDLREQFHSCGTWKALAKAATAHHVDIAPALIAVREAGGRVGVIGDKRDHIFDSRKMRRSVVDRDLVNDFELLNTGHVPLATAQGLRDVEVMGAQIIRLGTRQPKREAA